LRIFEELDDFLQLDLASSAPANVAKVTLGRIASEELGFGRSKG
jgi:hypothetical protein